MDFWFHERQIIDAGIGNSFIRLLACLLHNMEIVIAMRFAFSSLPEGY
jgi:hypothetical protein